MKHSQRFAAFALLSLLGGIIIVSRLWPPPWDTSSAAGDTRSESNPIQAASARGISESTSPGVSLREQTLERLAYAQAWTRVSEPAMVAFRAWTERYMGAPLSAQSTLESEGVILARARRPVILEMIKTDPQRALALTVPAIVRTQLPPSVLAEIETRISGRGDYLLLRGTPQPGGARAMPAARRVAFIGGVTYTAHTYGRREAQFAKHDASLHGVALDGELALHDNPVRVLDPGEIPVGAAGTMCSISGLVLTPPAPGAGANSGVLTVAEAFGRRWDFSATTDEMLAQFEHRLTADEDSVSTRVPLPGTARTAANAPTSRTVGNQRVLVIRVDFSDFPGATITAGDMQTMMDDKVRGFYDDASYGLNTLTTVVTTPVYRLPRTGRSYALANDVQPLHADARSLASVDYPLVNHDRIVVVFTDLGPSRVPGSRFDYFAGLGGGDYVWMMWPVPLWDYIVHELGHTYGLPHANLWISKDDNPVSTNGEIVGSDHYDMMGGPAPNALREDPRRHFNHYFKNKLGWLRDSAVTTVNASGTHRLYCFDHKDALARNQPLALRVFRQGNQWYWLGYRRAFANTSGTPQANGLGVLWNRGTTADSLLVDFNAPGRAIYDGTMPEGATLSDREYGITIRPVARGGSGPGAWIDVAIEVPSARPSVSAWWSQASETAPPAGLLNIRALAAGERHALALKADGTVAIWGDNTRRQLDMPPDLANVTAIAANDNVSAVVKADGTIAVWGESTSRIIASMPVGLSGVRQIALGLDHALALKVDGTVVAWGSNEWRQSSVPANLTNIVAVAAGSLNSTALSANGTVTTWGTLYGGSRPVPAGLADITAISGYYSHVLALKADGTVVGWGLNGIGQLNVPAGLSNVVAISAGKYYSLALKADGNVIAWGTNDYGQRDVPAGLPRVHAVTAGAVAAYALVGSQVYFTRQPKSRNIIAGAQLELSVEVSAIGTPTYQWRRNGVPIVGATGSTLTFNSVAVAHSGIYDVVLTDANTTAVSFPAVINVYAPLVISAQPRAQTAELGSKTALTVATTGGGPLTYQWRKNGTPIAGATTSSLAFNSVASTDGAIYDVSIADGANALASAMAALSVVPAGRISNLSIRTSAGTGAQTVIVGFVVTGSAAKPLLIRGVGPSLSGFGLTGVLADPKLELYVGRTKINENDNWAGSVPVSSVATQVGAFALASATSRDAALYSASTAPGSYSVQVSGVGISTGIVLAEIYDVSPASTFSITTPRLRNVSARTLVGTDADILIAGITISGVLPKNILIRGIGPALSAFGVTGILGDPKLELYRGAAKMDENDNWGGGEVLTNAYASVGAFALDAMSKDAALLVNLEPGSYTVQISGIDSTTGVALVEVYEVP